MLGINWNGHLGAVPELHIGRFVLKNVLTGYTEAVGKLGPDCEGLLGPGIFARFHVTFDYRHGRMFLEPNRYFDEPFQRRFRGWEQRLPAATGRRDAFAPTKSLAGRP